MASETGAKRLVLGGALLLAGAGWSAHGAASALALAGSAALALIALACLREGLNQLGIPTAPLELPPAPPPSHALLQLESQLECAPVALLRLGAGGGMEALNASARRLLAPGRASDAAQVHAKVAALATGQRGLIDYDTERGRERALCSVAELTIDGQPQRLAALMPVESELEAEAMQAWQQLVHVLTHEIMNSLTPVASLSGTVRELIGGVAAALPPDVAADLDTALDAIGRRAASLIQFVAGYRSLASVPAPQPERIVLADLFARLAALAGEDWRRRGGSALFTVEPETLALQADPGQLEQALVNLLANAADASAGLAAPQLQISARLGRGARLRIEVRDNGPGVPDQLVNQIFTPFFSTKANGSGIGLAMVRQLVHRNGGTVRYARSLGGGARFIISF